MAIGGPRLDRPSAIGDEGRPRAASTTVAALVVLLLLAATGYLAGTLRLVPVLGLATGLTVAGVALLERHRFPHLVVGHLCVHVAGTGLVLLLAGLALLPNGPVFAGYVVSLLGIAVTWANVGRAGALRSALGQAGTSYVGLLVVFAGSLLLGGGALLSWRILGAVFEESEPGLSLASFLGVVGIAAVLVAVASRGLPILELTRRDRRPDVERRIERTRSLLIRAGQVALVGSGLAIYAASLEVVSTSSAHTPLGDGLEVLSSPFVLGPVVGATVAVLAAGAIGGTARWLLRRSEGGRWRRVAAATAGGFLGVLVFLSAAAPGAGPTVEGVNLVTLGIVGPIEVLVVLGVAWFLLESGIVPERVLGPALAATGLVVATATLALEGFPPPLIFASAVGAVVVWDVTTFGLGLTVELGHRPDTRRLELFHAGLSLVVAVGAVNLLVGLDVLRGTVGDSIGAVPALALAGLGVTALLLALS